MKTDQTNCDVEGNVNQMFCNVFPFRSAFLSIIPIFCPFLILIRWARWSDRWSRFGIWHCCWWRCGHSIWTWSATNPSSTTHCKRRNTATIFTGLSTSAHLPSSCLYAEWPQSIFTIQREWCEHFEIGVQYNCKWKRQRETRCDYTVGYIRQIIENLEHKKDGPGGANRKGKSRSDGSIIIALKAATTNG